jgi:hypothetical protein
MNDDLNPQTTPVAAPGARAAKLCGIWSIVASFTCVGLPIGFALAIVALVQQAKAKRQAKEHPDFYEAPTATGLITGIIGLAMPVLMLPFLGIVSAIAIPALLSQRARARDKAAIETMVGRTADLVGQWDKQKEMNTPTEQMPAALEAWLAHATAGQQDPADPLQPACNLHIEIVSGLDQDEIGEMAAAQAKVLDQPVWILELPAADPLSPGATRLGYLSGAVRLQNSTETNPMVKTVELD